MKKLIIQSLVILLLGMFFYHPAHSQTDPKQQPDYQNNKNIYLQAIKYNDVTVARTALYKLIELDPNDISLMDSLAFLYFEYRQFASTALVCKDILEKLPKHPPALEMSAISFENLGLADQAIQQYEQLYLIQNNLATLYKITYLQYQLKRFAEFENNVKTLLEKEETKELKVFFTGEDNQQQQIPMNAALLNFRGLVAKENGNKQQAMEYFDEALKIAPDFYLAKVSKEQLDK
jgi:tetratricopeptide (TPR) repeat protein